MSARSSAASRRASSSAFSSEKSLRSGWPCRAAWNSGRGSSVRTRRPATRSKSVGIESASRSCRKHREGGDHHADETTSDRRRGRRRTDRLRGPRPGRRGETHLLFMGRSAQRSRKDRDARSLRQDQRLRGRGRLADQLRQTESDGGRRPPRVGPRRCRRPLHLARRRLPRAARHVADPQRQGAGRQLGGAQGHFHLDRRHRRRMEHQGVPGGRGAEILERLLGRETFPVPAASTRPSITTTKRLSWPPARRAPRSIPPPRTR